MGVGAVGMRAGGRAGRAGGAAIGGAFSGDAFPITANDTVPAVAWDGGRAGRAEGPATGDMTATRPGIGHANPRNVNDLIVTPGGTFSTHPDDYIMAMKNPAALLGEGIRDEVRAVEYVIREIPPLAVKGEILLHSELVIDDREYRLRQSVGRNTTPYKFAVGSAADARAIQ